MQTHIRGLFERAAGAQFKPGSPIPFIAATSNLARDGMVIDAAGWKLDNYLASPVVLWSHDYMGNHPPIGRAENVRVADGQLLCDIVFDSADPFAAEVERKVNDGFIRAVSVGWDTLEFQPDDANNPWGGGKVMSAELLDISVVNVPGDPGALKARQKRAYADMGRELLKLADVLDESDPPKPASKEPATDPNSERATWDETAASMVRVFQPFAQRPDAERKADHQRLSRDYARHGKTPPEFLTQDDCDALTGPSLRGLFLEGEPELHAMTFAAMESRAGAVLSTRNQADLKSASDLILAVLDRAVKESASETERAAEQALRDIHSTLKGTK